MIEPPRRRNNPRRLIGAEGQCADPDQVGTPGDVGQLSGNLTDTDRTAAADIDAARDFRESQHCQRFSHIADVHEITQRGS
jgi:hypothetical protein